jgi:hypothetical protein
MTLHSQTFLTLVEAIGSGGQNERRAGHAPYRISIQENELAR